MLNSKVTLQKLRISKMMMHLWTLVQLIISSNVARHSRTTKLLMKNQYKEQQGHRRLLAEQATKSCWLNDSSLRRSHVLFQNLSVAFLSKSFEVVYSESINDYPACLLSRRNTFEIGNQYPIRNGLYPQTFHL